MKQAPRRCPACDGLPRRSVRLAGGQWVVQCTRCRLAWWRWEAFDAAQFYDRDYYQSSSASKGYDDYAALAPGLLRTAHRRLDLLARLRPGRDALDRGGGSGDGSRRLLDVGCGTGVFLDAARDRGWRVAGIEVSAYAAQTARERGHDVCTEPIEAVEKSEQGAQVDCVTLWDCIEHLPDPQAALRAAAARLKVGGVVAISTGDVSSLCAWLTGPHWHLYNLPEHLFFFSPLALSLLLRRVGCRVVALRREVNWVSVAYVIERLLKRVRHDDAKPQRVLSQWFVPATLLDVVGIYARKV